MPAGRGALPVQPSLLPVQPRSPRSMPLPPSGSRTPSSAPFVPKSTLLVPPSPIQSCPSAFQSIPVPGQSTPSVLFARKSASQSSPVLSIRSQIPSNPLQVYTSHSQFIAVYRSALQVYSSHSQSIPVYPISPQSLPVASQYIFLCKNALFVPSKPTQSPPSRSQFPVEPTTHNVCVYTSQGGCARGAGGLLQVRSHLPMLRERRSASPPSPGPARARRRKRMNPGTGAAPGVSRDPPVLWPRVCPREPGRRRFPGAVRYRAERGQPRGHGPGRGGGSTTRPRALPAALSGLPGLRLVSISFFARIAAAAGPGAERSGRGGSAGLQLVPGGERPPTATGHAGRSARPRPLSSLLLIPPWDFSSSCSGGCPPTPPHKARSSCSPHLGLSKKLLSHIWGGSFSFSLPFFFSQVPTQTLPRTVFPLEAKKIHLRQV